jgi:hypothetical protein
LKFYQVKILKDLLDIPSTESPEGKLEFLMNLLEIGLLDDPTEDWYYEHGQGD